MLELSLIINLQVNKGLDFAEKESDTIHIYVFWTIYTIYVIINNREVGQVGTFIFHWTREVVPNLESDKMIFLMK